MDGSQTALTDSLLIWVSFLCFELSQCGFLLLLFYLFF